MRWAGRDRDSLLVSLFMLLAAELLAPSAAFVQIPPAAHCLARSKGGAAAALVKMSVGDDPVTRNEAVRRAWVGSGVLAGVLCAPGVISADEGKDEVQQFGELRGALEREQKAEETKENLKRLTEATAGLKTLDFYIGEKDYQSLRVAMRRPPIVYLRSSARKVITSMENDLEAKRTQAAYTALITSVDKLDGIASKGLKEKGGLKDDKELVEVYGNCMERGSALLDLLPENRKL